jgi:hypothetical protein
LNSITHTQRVSAQLDGLRSTMEAHNTKTKADLVNIRGLIVPNLRKQATALASNVQLLEECFGEQASALALNVQRLEDCLGNFDPTDFTLTVDCFEEHLDAFRTKFDEYTTNPCRACIPPLEVNARTHAPPIEVDDTTSRAPNIGGGRFAHVDPTFHSTSSWYACDTPCHDDSADRGSGMCTHPNHRL